MNRQTGFLDRVIYTGGVARRYVLYLPAEFDEWRGWPTILYLHGRGESGTDGLLQLAIGLPQAIMRSRKEWPFVVIAPQKAEQDSLWADERDLLADILLEVQNEVAVDSTRRYITGLSQGGRGTMELAANLPWKFAAAAPVCGWSEPLEVCPGLASIPLWAFHGALDTVVPPNGSQRIVDGIRGLGGDAKLTLYPDLEHNCWDRAYREEHLAEWFLSHKIELGLS